MAHRTPPSLKALPAVYIPVPSPFTELEEFIWESARAYNLDLFACSSESDAPLPVESVTPGTATPNARKQGEEDYVGRFLRPVGNARGGEGMRRALHLYKERYPQIEAILVGTRRTDPHGGEFFCLRIDRLVTFFGSHTHVQEQDGCWLALIRAY